MTIAAVLKHKEGGRNVIAVPPSARISEVAELISSRRIGAVLVLDDADTVLGILSERDVVKGLAQHGEAVLSLKASDLMTGNPTSVTPDTSIDHALEIMDAGYFRHLPVMQAGQLAGIISVRDLVKYRIMEHQHDVETLRAYVTRGA
ncbi:MAG: CBS domain-containing protein [Acetobacteraceae bacterium]|nr:CBS domain-containing protein [Acetobacteraceae bacterium]